MDTTPLWEEAARRVSGGSNWLVGSCDIVKLLKVDSIAETDLEAGYDPDIWGKSFRFDRGLGTGFDEFELRFTPVR